MWVLYWHIHLKNSGCQHHHLGHLLQSKTELFNILVPTLAQVVMEARIVAVCFMIIIGAVRGNDRISTVPKICMLVGDLSR